MDKWYENKDFLKLQTKWYKKLKCEGFDDIEYHDSKVLIGKDNLTSNKFIKKDGPQTKCSIFTDPDDFYTRNVFDSNQFEYYRRCRLHLINHKWKNDFDKIIFTWHTNGISYRKMVKLYKPWFIDRVLSGVLSSKLKRCEMPEKLKLMIRTIFKTINLSHYSFFKRTTQLINEMNELKLWKDNEDE